MEQVFKASPLVENRIRLNLKATYKERFEEEKWEWKKGDTKNKKKLLSSIFKCQEYLKIGLFKNGTLRFIY